MHFLISFATDSTKIAQRLIVLFFSFSIEFSVDMLTTQHISDVQDVHTVRRTNLGKYMLAESVRCIASLSTPAPEATR